jgi:hypothetical protein
LSGKSKIKIGELIEVYLNKEIIDKEDIGYGVVLGYDAYNDVTGELIADSYQVLYENSIIQIPYIKSKKKDNNDTKV